MWGKIVPCKQHWGMARPRPAQPARPCTPLALSHLPMPLPMPLPLPLQATVVGLKLSRRVERPLRRQLVWGAWLAGSLWGSLLIAWAQMLLRWGRGVCLWVGGGRGGGCAPSRRAQRPQAEAVRREVRVQGVLFDGFFAGAHHNARLAPRPPT